MFGVLTMPAIEATFTMWPRQLASFEAASNIKGMKWRTPWDHAPQVHAQHPFPFFALRVLPDQTAMSHARVVDHDVGVPALLAQFGQGMYISERDTSPRKAAT